MQNKKPKVLFTFVEAGFGHIVPMIAISEAFEKKYGEKCQVIKSYVFRDSKHKEVVQIGKELSDSTKLASRNYLYNRLEAIAYSFSSEFTHWFLDLHFKKGEQLFMEELQELAPDMVVASYYLPTHITAKANEKGLTNALTVTYSPDIYIYPAWDRNCDMFIVNNFEAYSSAIKKGFDKDKVVQVPFLFRENITALKKSKDECREELGLDKDKYQVLFACGANGSRNITKSIKAILDSDLDIELTVVCGKNPKMEEEVKKLVEKGKGKVKLNLVAYTDLMAEYIKASDVVIGKAGSNTLIETLYLGTPLIVCDLANRLEEITIKHYVKEKMALRVTNPKKLVRLLTELTKDKTRLQYCAENFKKLNSEGGALIVADKIFELLKSRYPELN